MWRKKIRQQNGKMPTSETVDGVGLMGNKSYRRQRCVEIDAEPR